jgi:hypothetical protein
MTMIMYSNTKKWKLINKNSRGKEGGGIIAEV